MSIALRDIPTYSISEAAHYLKVPSQTLRYWVLGKNYRTKNGIIRSDPLINITDNSKKLMSFTNLVEGYILSAIRRTYNISMTRIRPALIFLEKKYKTQHPLMEKNHSGALRDRVWQINTQHIFSIFNPPSPSEKSRFRHEGCVKQTSRFVPQTRSFRTRQATGASALSCQEPMRLILEQRRCKPYVLQPTADSNRPYPLFLRPPSSYQGVLYSV